MLARTALVLSALGLLGGLAAGCGGGTSSPGVASLGPATTSTSSQAAVGGAPSQSPAGPGNPTALLPFVHCMQSHGVQAQIASGGKGIGISGGANPNSSQFQAAQKDCQKLLPGGGPKPLTPAEQAQNQKALLELAACMRSHGFPNFPDPSSQGVFNLSNSSGVDPGSSQFQSAMTTCQPKNATHLRIGIRAAGPPGGSK